VVCSYARCHSHHGCGGSGSSAGKRKRYAGKWRGFTEHYRKRGFYIGRQRNPTDMKRSEYHSSRKWCPGTVATMRERTRMISPISLAVVEPCNPLFGPINSNDCDIWWTLATLIIDREPPDAFTFSVPICELRTITACREREHQAPKPLGRESKLRSLDEMK